MLFALQQIFNPSVRQQFPNFPFKAKKDWWVGVGRGSQKPHKNKTKNNNNPQ